MGEMGLVGGRDTAEVGPFPEHPIEERGRSMYHLCRAGAVWREPLVVTCSGRILG
jgi:hypothetical protein